MNNQLKVCGVRVIDIKHDLQDGLILIALMEILSGTKCTAKYHLQPSKEIHKIENCAIAIDFIKKFININVAAKGE
jgi:filamin